MRIVILVFILGTLYSVSFAQSAQPCIFCQYGGAGSKEKINYSFTFSVDDVPERCDIIGYGGTFFDTQPAEEDLEAIKQLKNAGKTVFMSYVCPYGPEWERNMSSNDPTILDKAIAPMLSYLSESNLDGIFLESLTLLGNVIPNYETIITNMICKIKECAPNLKIGIIVYSNIPDFYGYSDVFDFNVINSLVDFYSIDTTLLNSCGSCTSPANGGRLPLTSNGTDANLFTLETILANVFISHIDKDKLYINLNDLITWTGGNESDMFLPYYDYCTGPVSETNIYCTDTMKQIYDTAVYAKKYFKGIQIYFLSSDDWGDSCGCGKFPVANTYIDGWYDQPLKSCDRIG